MRRATYSLCSLSMLLLGGWSSCQPSVDRDPSFDLWCGQNLCQWQTDLGTVQRVPTWNEDDYGVGMAGSEVQISQLVTETSTQTPGCLQFELISSIDSNASLTLGLDFGDDGTVDYQAPIPATNWQSAVFLVSAPTWFSKVRFIIHKTGAGSAILSELRITEGQGCSAPPLAMSNRPAAAPCSADAECSSGSCGDSVFPYLASAPGIETACGGCKSDNDCAQGQVCGVSIASLGMAPGCTSGETRVGERCIEDADCASGVCCGQVCSTCCSSHACAGGAACAETPDPSNGKLLWVLRPSLCAPGQHESASGTACLEDSDCQSGTCDSSALLKVCWIDGRRCQIDSDCPAASQDLTGQQAACISLGKEDGHCH